MIDGVLAEEDCWKKESSRPGMLGVPAVHRPVEFRGRKVPEVLLSGHHANIERWRLSEALKKTIDARPDLLEGESSRITDIPGKKTGAPDEK